MLGLIRSFSTLSISDIDVAVDFYANTLGIIIFKTNMRLLELQLPKNSVLFHKKEFKEKKKGPPIAWVHEPFR